MSQPENTKAQCQCNPNSCTGACQCKTSCHCKAALVSGVVFALIALFHVVRLVMGWPASVGTWDIPTWASIVGIGITGALALCNFCRCRQCQKCFGNKASCSKTNGQ